MVTAARSPLGNQLRQYRTSAGLSQAALAEAAGLSLRGVSDLERGLKTRPHPSTLRMLADALELDPGQRADLAALSRPARTIARSEAPTGAAMPAMIGRDAERALLQHLLADPVVRIVTVTGPGGVGKTRIARDLAQSVDGCTFVDLAPLATGSTVVAAIASRLAVRDDSDRPVLDLIRESLENQGRVLVLDNCEHVLDGVRAAMSVLLEAPGVRFVATSRSPLRLTGERVLALDPLAVPATDATLVAIAGADAVRLLVERAREVRPGFDITSQNAAAVREICTRVDGLPLAIELAASRLRSIPPETLADLLDQRLRILTTGPLDAPVRHQTLRATIAWSFDLLDSGQQAMLRALSVFAGGFTLESAAQVAVHGDPFATIDGIDALVDQALVSVAGDGRYRMLEMVREFGLGELAESGEEAQVRNAHAKAMLAFATEAGDGLGGPAAATWLGRYAAEEANLLAALDWLIDLAAEGGDASPAVALAVQLWPWWHMLGRHRESEAWLDRVIALGDRVDPAERSWLYIDLANAANNLDQHARARTLYQQVRSIGQDLGDDALIAQAAIGTGMVATATGDYPIAVADLDEAMAIAGDGGTEFLRLSARYARGRLATATARYDDAQREFGLALGFVSPDDVGTRTYVQMELVQVLRLQGNWRAATKLALDCREILAGFGERRAVAVCDIEIGHLALAQGDVSTAASTFAAVATSCLDARDELGLVRAIEGSALVAMFCNRPEVAAQLASAADSWRMRTGTVREVWERQVEAGLTVASPSPLVMGFEQAVQLGLNLAIARDRPVVDK